MSSLPGLAILLLVAATLVLLVLVGLLVREARHPRRRTAAYAVARGMPCDPGDIGLDFEAWMLDRPGGVHLAVWEATTNAVGLDSDPELTVIFAHGWGQSRIDMLLHVEPWRTLASRLVLYDLRGHGESEGGASDLGDGEDADLAALIERLDAPRCILVGFSMGAVIAIATAADAAVRDRIAGVVAYGPYVDFHASLRGRLETAGLPVRPITDLAMLWFRARGIRHRSVLSAARAMTCPLLVVHGDSDRVVPSDHAAAFAAAVPDAVILRVPEGGHLDARRVDAAAHDRAIERFVRWIRTRPEA